MDPAFSRVFPLDGVIDFFICLVKNWFLEKDLELPLILIFFLREKQNKKEKP